MIENPGHILSVAEIDREIAVREREIDAIAATLVELDKHAGLVLLRRFPPTGITETRWLPVRAELDLLWEDFGRVRTILDQAHAARTRRKLDAFDREHLTVLLRGRPLEVARNPIPLSQRTLSGPWEQVEHMGFAELLARMRLAFPRIVELLDAVEAVNSRVMSEIAPLRAELDRLGTDLPELYALADDLAELSGLAATDPLSLSTKEIDHRLARLTTLMGEAVTIRAELAEIARDWDGAIAELRTRVDALRTTYERADQAAIAVERTIRTGPLPRHADDSALYSAELSTLQANAPAPAALWDLRRRLNEAIAAAAHNEELALGLLDRRAELRGRLSGYRAKAARLGVSEDRDVLASGRIAAGLLTRKPCDLAAVTRAIADYQQLIAQKSGRRT